MDIQLINCGYCDGKKHHVLKGGERKSLQFPAMTALLKHPSKGYILFDTGYTDRFYEETKRWPGKIYAWMTPTYVKKEEYLVHQLAKQGIGAAEIEYIIISHFHADHCAGLKDFPNAKLICSNAAYQNLNRLKNKPWKALLQGILLGLLPSDLEERVCIYNEEGNHISKKHHIFGKIHDLFNDETIKIIPLEGHHKGQIGLLLNTSKGAILLAADACWLGQAYKENRMPASITKLLLSDWSAFRESLKKLHLYYLQNPTIPIIPTHCAATHANYPQFFEPLSK